MALFRWPPVSPQTSWIESCFCSFWPVGMSPLISRWNMSHVEKNAWGDAKGTFIKTFHKHIHINTSYMWQCRQLWWALQPVRCKLSPCRWRADQSPAARAPAREYLCGPQSLQDSAPLDFWLQNQSRASQGLPSTEQFPSAFPHHRALRTITFV